MNALTDKVFGKLYADKGYISQTLFGRLRDNGVHIVTGLRGNIKQRLMPLYDKIMLRKRSIIESVNDGCLKMWLNLFTQGIGVYTIF